MPTPTANTDVHDHVTIIPRLIFPDWDRSNEQQPASSTSCWSAPEDARDNQHVPPLPGQHKTTLVTPSTFQQAPILRVVTNMPEYKTTFALLP